MSISAQDPLDPVLQELAAVDRHLRNALRQMTEWPPELLEILERSDRNADGFPAGWSDVEHLIRSLRIVGRMCYRYPILWPTVAEEWKTRQSQAKR